MTCVKALKHLFRKGVIRGYQPKPYTHPQNGQIYYEYFLNKRDTYILVAQFSPEFTAAVIDRWQELENQQNPTALFTAELSSSLRAVGGIRERETSFSIRKQSDET